MKAALLIAPLAALVACTGMVEEGESGASLGEEMFNSTVAPMLRSKCASCHEAAGAGPAFLGASGGNDDYATLLANGRVVGGFSDTAALLVTKGAHSGVTWWSADQLTMIKSWLKAELDDYGPGGVTDVMAVWAGCMTQKNWDDSQMNMWAAKQTDGGQATCGGCHADGEYGFHANPTSALMLAQNRTAIGIGSFFQMSAAGSEPEVAPSIAKLRSKCSGQNLHPSCAVDDQYVEYLERFYLLTRATLHAGLCETPGYPDPTVPPPGP